MGGEEDSKGNATETEDVCGTDLKMDLLVEFFKRASWS